MARSLRRGCLGALGPVVALACRPVAHEHPAQWRTDFLGLGGSIAAAGELPLGDLPFPPLPADGAAPQPSGLQRARGAAGLAAAAAALGFLAAGVVGRQRRCRGGKSAQTRRRAYRDESQSRTNPLVKLPEPPETLYDLLRVPADSSSAEIKKAYHEMQKVCHPDVAGPEGEEMCILLNDAYDTLTNPEGRQAYDENMVLAKTHGVEIVDIEQQDLQPTWKWKPKIAKKKPIYDGIPRSRSCWDRVPPEDRGPNHQQQKFVYVDEFSCISCRNCCDIAPKSFCIDIEHGRARVYAQWNHPEEYFDYAIQSCPVDCIHWVSREELQILEHVTADTMYEKAGWLPCPMQAMQGMLAGEELDDPFELASAFKEKYKRDRVYKREMARSFEVRFEMFRKRILEVFGSLSKKLRLAGWG